MQEVVESLQSEIFSLTNIVHNWKVLQQVRLKWTLWPKKKKMSPLSHTHLIIFTQLISTWPPVFFFFFLVQLKVKNEDVCVRVREDASRLWCYGSLLLHVQLHSDHQHNQSLRNSPVLHTLAFLPSEHVAALGFTETLNHTVQRSGQRCSERTAQLSTWRLARCPLSLEDRSMESTGWKPERTASSWLICLFVFSD